MAVTVIERAIRQMEKWQTLLYPQFGFLPPLPFSRSPILSLNSAYPLSSAVDLSLRLEKVAWYPLSYLLTYLCLPASEKEDREPEGSKSLLVTAPLHLEVAVVLSRGCVFARYKHTQVGRNARFVSSFLSPESCPPLRSK